jgi:hypothetical protein
VVYTIPGFLHHREQEEDLDDLSETIMRLGAVGLTIHEELSSQERLIDELGNDMDSTATRLDFIQVDNLPPFSPVQGNLARKSSVKLQGVLILFRVLPI